MAIYPQKAQKILSQVESTHGGKVNDSRFMKRMLGEGKIAELASRMMQAAKKKHFKDRAFPDFKGNGRPSCIRSNEKL